MVLSTLKLALVGCVCIIAFDFLRWMQRQSRPAKSLDWLHQTATREPAKLVYDAKLDIWVLTLPDGREVMSNRLHNLECDLEVADYVQS